MRGKKRRKELQARDEKEKGTQYNNTLTTNTANKTNNRNNSNNTAELNFYQYQINNINHEQLN
jgi:hypothetical protein